MFAYLQNGNLGVQVCSDIMTWNKSVHYYAIELCWSQAFWQLLSLNEVLVMAFISNTHTTLFSVLMFV